MAGNVIRVGAYFVGALSATEVIHTNDGDVHIPTVMFGSSGDNQNLVVLFVCVIPVPSW